MTKSKTATFVLFGLFSIFAAAAGPRSAWAIGNCSWAPFDGDSQYFPIVISDLSKDSRKRADGSACGAKDQNNVPDKDRGTCFGYVQCDGLEAYPVYCPRQNGCFFTDKGATDCARAFAAVAPGQAPGPNATAKPVRGAGGIIKMKPKP